MSKKESKKENPKASLKELGTTLADQVAKGKNPSV